MFNKGLKFIAFILVAMIAVYATSCVDSLNTSPIDDNVVTSVQVYDTPENFKQVLAKMYAGLAITGQQGPAGQPDIQGIDEGFSSYIRQLWVHQVLSTDEAVVAWNDPGLPQFNTHAWGASNDFVRAMYSRIYYQVTLANEFIREAQARDEAVIQEYLTEARYLRALSYWHAFDLFGGSIPFVTEDDVIGAFMPEPATAQELFDYIESELLAIEGELPTPQGNDYGRADQGAAWTLLAKLYLNAEVYTGQQRYDDARTYAARVIDEGGYSLANNYEHLFMTDNHQTNEEIIFPVRFDGDNMRTFGGTTFIIHAAIGGNMNPSEYGVGGGWAGHRVTPEFVSLFDSDEDHTGAATENTGGYPEIYVPGGYQNASGYGNDWSPDQAPALISENSDNVYSGVVYFANAGTEFKFTAARNWDDGDWGGSDGQLDSDGDNLTIAQSGLYTITVDLNNMTYSLETGSGDSRAMFHTDGQTLEIESIGQFTEGYAVTKWKNVSSTGQPGKNNEFVDTNFPLFRLADVYLTFAEAAVRTGSETDQALALVNELRERAYGDASGNITSSQLTLDFIIDERARELYWEGHRRTDLRRFGLFTSGDYTWSWKGGTQDGSGTSDHFNLFPIPSADLNENLNLTQNPGY